MTLCTLTQPPRRLTLTALLCLTGALGACHSSVAEGDAAPLTVRTVRPGVGGPAVTPRFPATLAWDRESVLSFRVAGVVAAVEVRQGQNIARGQSVARLVATPYEAAVTRAQVELARLQRSQKRNETLLPAGAIASSVQEDTDSSAEGAQAALRAADYDLASTRLQAPYRATVLLRQVEAGDTVAPGQAVVRIADLDSPLIAHVAIPQRLAQRLHVGDASQVSIDGAGTALLAHVARLGTWADARTNTVTVDLLLPHSAVAVSGAVGSATFAAASPNVPRDVQTLPAEALLDVTAGRGHVLVLDPRDSTVHRTDIEVLDLSSESIEIRGLPADARVVTTGAGFARDGQRVREITP